MSTPSSHLDDQDMMYSVFYIAIIPVLNPIIYTVREKQVKKIASKILKKKCLGLTFPLVLFLLKHHMILGGFVHINYVHYLKYFPVIYP